MITIVDPFDVSEDFRRPKETRWTGTTVASWEALLKAKGGSAQALVWPDEGAETSKGIWKFNDKHDEFEPLIIDAISASMIVALHDALNAKNQEKLRAWVAICRGHFGAIWEMTQERVTITGFQSRRGVRA